MTWTPTDHASIAPEDVLLGLLTQQESDPPRGWLTPSDLADITQAVLSKLHWLNERDLYVPVEAMWVVTGSPVLATAQERRWWLLDPAADEMVGFYVRVPPTWNTYDVTFAVTNPAAGAGNVTWRYNSRWDTDGISLTSPSGVLTTVAAPAQHVLDFVTVANGFVVTHDALLHGQPGRQGTDGLDTLANDAALLGVILSRAS